MRKTEPQSLLTLGTSSKPPVFDETVRRVWYFGFCQNEVVLPWYQKLAMRKDPPHLTHTYAFTQADDFVLFVEPHRCRVDFTIKFPIEGVPVCCAHDMAQTLTAAGHVIVRHGYQPNIRGKKTAFNFIPSCVTVVKVATGFASLARTPRQLLHDLLRDGAFLYLDQEK